LKTFISNFTHSLTKSKLQYLAHQYKGMQPEFFLLEGADPEAIGIIYV
jgi:hypothetical protein